MSDTSAEQACVYAALILHDDGVDITADKLAALVKAAGVDVEPVWFSIFAKALAGRNVGDLLMNVGSGAAAAPAGGTPAGGAAAGGSAAEAKAEEKAEEKEESDEDMGFGLFD
ncbi:MAG: 60s acidic ribosomal protein-domain-containing protein [Olpidium bornovanus]|uniref:60s acidic ribosomal protein-domain-containing protein n=1 Tax=Olpidium bornovanus TaxID=278681 RepID=A0A8H8A2N9_9FUNG|nr:MAG: 60s acidic ribosomal protein-domain-containing protein [Olpidium bornovanus]